MAEGAIGQDPGGRRSLVAIAIAFVPAAIVGLIGTKFIEDHLLKVGPVIAAWIVGALVIFAFAKRFSSDTPGTSLDAITVRQAVIIGAAQCLALWPGTSRSMVTILAALLVGLSLSAAIEFSFLLGLLTVSAATAYGLLAPRRRSRRRVRRHQPADRRGRGVHLGGRRGALDGRPTCSGTAWPSSGGTDWLSPH